MRENRWNKSLIFLLILFCFGFTDPGFGQKNRPPKDPMDTEAMFIGFGFGPAIQYYSGYSAGFGPGFGASFEKGMWQLGPGVLTLGAELGFSYFAYNGDFWDVNGDHAGYSYNWFTSITAVRSAYHYGWDVKGLDTYGGIAAGMRFLIFNETYDSGYPNAYNPGSIYPFVGMFVGTSYFFNDLIGINGELGYNINYAQIGMTFKLR
jgi:hypothetical protein